jgi:hypothetical protein
MANNKEEVWMKGNNRNFMDRFIQDRGNIFQTSLKYYNGNTPFLHISTPEALLDFASYIKFHLKRIRTCKVFVRGNDKFHLHLIPSLFRFEQKDPFRLECLHVRKKAYDWVLAEIKKRHHLGTLKSKDNIGPMLQHYGFYTPWLDVVDNLFVALWFSQHKMEKQNDKSWCFTPSKGKYCWLVFIADKISQEERLKLVDLRENMSSLNLRMAAQHGYSLTYNRLTKNDNNSGAFEFDSFIVGRIRYPNNTDFMISSPLMSVKNLFPSIAFDKTASFFFASDFQKVVSEAEKKYKLEDHELGRYSKVVYK